jgi:hypothetical protein
MGNADNGKYVEKARESISARAWLRVTAGGENRAFRGRQRS